MYRRDRQLLPDFDGNESLYLRYGRDDFESGQLASAAIRFPRASVNRGRLSEPEDVLFAEDGKYNGLGVVEFEVSDIPSNIAQEQGPTYVFFMRHVPLAGNYSHSEIWSDHASLTGNYREPSKTVKLKFRILLCRRITQERIRIHGVLNRAS